MKDDSLDSRNNDRSTENPDPAAWFTRAGYGMFVHYGLFSLLGRGEWVMNRERIPPKAYRTLADRFTAEKFDAEALCDLAVAGGMQYVNLVTMHHEGFRLYETELSDFHSVAACGRDLVEEFVSAARDRDLKVALYHSLNNWMDTPDACDALESQDAYEAFIGNTFARIRELVTRFNPIDILWYDGWWPFNAEQWKGEEMNAMVREIQPHILFNGRNGLPGDFGTPEGHLAAPDPWRPWEACMTLNEHWGFHKGDEDWKSPRKVIELLITAAQGRGNLLLNIGPRGDGSVPERSEAIVREVGAWLERHGDCLDGTDLFSFGLMDREGHNGDWSSNGPFTLKGRTLYQQLLFYPGSDLVVAGLNTEAERVILSGREEDIECEFTQEAGTIRISGLPNEAPDPLCPVLRLECRDVPEIRLGGGMRIPDAPHPPYDPCPSDIAH